MKSKTFLPLIMVLTVAIAVILFVAMQPENKTGPYSVPGAVSTSTLGVCPPFYLLTDEGDTINPVLGLNTDKPYSPKQTCGKCHDYELITRGFHFQQGKEEDPPAIQKERMQWVSSPGNYGGPWCSPAPLYNYLSEKENSAAQVMDMSSYNFVISCGVCHPGGGPLEYDRNGMRYDSIMKDPLYSFTSGGVNDLDGDYYKARWAESGIIEADCYICHLPGYDNETRVRHIVDLNFKWAATAGSGLGTVTGSVASNTPVTVNYNRTLFKADGTVEPHIVREPRNEACLFCHAKPGWKKRGANFQERTDVHLRAGLKCVDCHPAGMAATHDLIRGKEVHQFGKGDDPGGHVRDDLDNTMRSCADCHDNGYLGAPVAKHRWLPPVHLDKMACQACHIPGRTVKSAHFVASDVFNPGTKIPTRGKYLWTFYGPDMNYWNHYGDLEMMGYDDKPTYAFRPELVRYKGMIYPVNRVHTAWPAIQTEGIPGLMQPKMGDIYKMWADHFQDPGKYAELASIRDDNNDNVIEVNSAGEIDALIAAITRKLAETSYPMENSQVVWVMNDRVYASGDTYTEIPMEPWEASPYGNVHTYNHDIFPANSALGVNGCTDCHSYGSDFFTARVVQYPFDSDGHTVTVPQFTSLGISGLQAHSGMIRESFLKPVLYLLIAIFIILAVILGFRRLLEPLLPALWLNASSILIFIGFLFILIRAIPDEQLSLYMLPSRFWLDSNHFFIGILVLLTSAALLAYSMNLQGAGSITRSKLRTPGVHLLVTASMIVAVISGSLMMLLNHWAIYILFDLGLILSLTGSILVLYAAGVQKQKEIITSTDQLK